MTYNHHPLYTFVQDTGKGQANGENVDAFGAEWYAVSATGAKVEKSAAKSSGGNTSRAAFAAPGHEDRFRDASGVVPTVPSAARTALVPAASAPHQHRCDAA